MRTSEFGATKAATYDAQDRLLTYNQANGQDWTFTYRDDGTLYTAATSDGTTTYDYDALGNLNRVTLPNETIDYIVDGKGRRIAKQVNGTITKRWIYDGQLRIAAELSGTMLNRFVYASRTSTPEMMIQYTTGSPTPTAVYRIFSDHLGSPRLVVNVADGSVLFQANYKAFGARTMVTGAEDAIPFGFAGGLYDPDTMLTRFGARDYDARFGRWVSKDPILFRGRQSNFYVYSGNDPANQSDPQGLTVYACQEYLLDWQHYWWILSGFSHSYIDTDSNTFGLYRESGTNLGKIHDDSSSGGVCNEIPDVDEDCVNSYALYNASWGDYSWINNCGTFVADVLNRCRVASSATSYPSGGF